MGESIVVFFDNIVYYLQSSGGGSVYWYELTKRLALLNHFKINFIEYKFLEMNFLSEKRKKISRVNIIYSFFKPLVASLIPFYKYERGKYIFHSSYYRYSICKNAINVITIHDFIPEKYFNGLSKYIAIYRKKMAIKYASGIICVSKNTYDDLRCFYPSIIKKQIEVIYNGVSNEYFLLNNKNIKKEILFIGKRDQYKNFDIAVKVVSQLKDFTLIIIGKPLTKNELEYISKYNIKFKILSNVENSKLNEIYNESFCLLYPSSYEGFGIPVIEAMKAGCPVVALDASSVAEISGGAALLAKDLSVLEFLELIKSLDNIEYRNQVIEKGLKNASKFSWETTASKTANFYLKLKYESKK